MEIQRILTDDMPGVTTMSDAINSYEDLTDSEKTMFHRIADAVCIERQVRVSFDAFKTSFDGRSFERPYVVQDCYSHLHNWLDEYLAAGGGSLHASDRTTDEVIGGGHVDSGSAKHGQGPAVSVPAGEAPEEFCHVGTERGRWPGQTMHLSTEGTKPLPPGEIAVTGSPATSDSGFKAPTEWRAAVVNWLLDDNVKAGKPNQRKSKWLESCLACREAANANQLDESGWRDLLRSIERTDLAEAPLCARREPSRAEVSAQAPEPVSSRNEAWDLLRYEVQPPEPTTVSDHFQAALSDLGHPYYELAHALLGAFEQAAIGKGKERHANDLAFTEQKILQLPKQQGHVGGLIYQVAKKALESERMKPDARVRELRGVIVYAAAAIVHTEGTPQ